jgi:biotin transport system substrate-specific component
MIVNLLGPYYGTLACGVYLLLGSIGLPVFAGGGAGPAVLFGPLGGYLFAFPLSALIGGAISGKRVQSKKKDAVCVAIATAVSLIIIYLVGPIWLSESLGISLDRAFVVGALAFIPVDAAKAFLAVPLSLYFRWSRNDLPVHRK